MAGLARSCHPACLGDHGHRRPIQHLDERLAAEDPPELRRGAGLELLLHVRERVGPRAHPQGPRAPRRPRSARGVAPRRVGLGPGGGVDRGGLEFDSRARDRASRSEAAVTLEGVGEGESSPTSAGTLRRRGIRRLPRSGQHRGRGSLRAPRSLAPWTRGGRGDLRGEDLERAAPRVVRRDRANFHRPPGAGHRRPRPQGGVQKAERSTRSDAYGSPAPARLAMDSHRRVDCLRSGSSMDLPWATAASTDSGEQGVSILDTSEHTS